MKLINCPKCGCRNSYNSKKCIECDFDIKEYLNITPKAKEKNRILLYCAAILIVLACVCISYKIIQSKQKKAAEYIEINASDMIQDNKTLAEEKENSTNVDEKSVVGTYSGDDHEILAICNNGYAYYYCIDPEFVELECSWKLENDKVIIEFSKMYCNITADIKNNDFSELVFKSDSPNWNPEVFFRMDLDPDDYIKRNVQSHDPAVIVNNDGTMSFTLENISFTIPKQYRDLEDEFDSMDNAFTFISSDAATDYVSSILFYSDVINYNTEDIDEKVDSIFSIFSSAFLEDVNISSAQSFELAEKPAFSASLTGYLNKGFTGLSGYNVDGKIIYVLDSDSNRGLYILMIQSSDRKYDETDIYNDILNKISY